MLQRIQSIFLLLALLANLSILFLPVWSFSSGQNSETLNGLLIQATVGAEAESEEMTAFDHGNINKLLAHSAVLGLSIVSAILLLVTIFLYNNRKRQKSLAYLCIVLTMMLLLSTVLLTQLGPSLIQAPEGSPSYGFFMPVAGILLTWLAISRIQKDEDLVNSLDRIR